MNECLKHGKKLNVGSDLRLYVKDLRLDLRLNLKGSGQGSVPTRLRCGVVSDCYAGINRGKIFIQ